jgi:hypothetical protein
MKTVTISLPYTRLETFLLDSLAPSEEDVPLSRQFWSELKADAAQILSREQRAKKRRTKG